MKLLFFKVYKSGLWGFVGVNNDIFIISIGFYLFCYYYNKYVIYFNDFVFYLMDKLID